jgi:hypothetical protein
VKRKILILGMLKNTFILIFSILFLISCKLKREDVDLIVWNARIYTVNPDFFVTEAMAIKDGKIIEIGSDESILGRYRAKDTLKLQGKTVFPGFIDAHCHFTGFATDMWKCNLVGTQSFNEILEKIRNYAKTAPMQWIYGRGWDQNDWEVKEFPDKTELDKLFPNRPVFLKRIDGHAALANQYALNLMGITVNTKVKGGSVEIKNGKLTGILLDNAMDLIDLKIPPISDGLAKNYYKNAEQICFSYGLTGVHDCGISDHTIELLDEEQKAGRLKMKVFAMISYDTANFQTWINKGIYKSERLKVGGFKIYTDGALGSRGACLLKPYSDKKNWSGLLITEPQRLNAIAAAIAETDFQMCSHAIGDSANRLILKTYAAALKGKNGKRWRVEHAQVLDETDFSYFKNYYIIPSVQPTHATSDMYWARERLGEKRMKYAYAYKALLDTVGIIALGTDFPVEDISPLKTFYAAVERKDSKGFPANGFQKESALSRKETLKGMTIWAACAAHEENEKGSLEPGKSADFIVLDADLMSCEDDAILKTQILLTYLNGEVVYKKN